MACQLLTASWLALAMWTGLTGFVWLATVVLLAEMHMVFECAALAPLRQQHADLFAPHTDTMHSFFAQRDHLGVLNYVIDCLNFMHMVGTSNQCCWLAKGCKIPSLHGLWMYDVTMFSAIQSVP